MESYKFKVARVRPKEKNEDATTEEFTALRIDREKWEAIKKEKLEQGLEPRTVPVPGNLNGALILTWVRKNEY